MVLSGEPQYHINLCALYSLRALSPYFSIILHHVEFIWSIVRFKCLCKLGPG